MKIQVVALWLVTPCSVAIRYDRFGGPCCLHLQGEVTINAARSSETLLSYRNTTWHHNLEDVNLYLFIIGGICLYYEPNPLQIIYS